MMLLRRVSGMPCPSRPLTRGLLGGARIRAFKVGSQRRERLPAPVLWLALGFTLALAAAACGGSTAGAARTATRYTDPDGWSLTVPVGTSIERSGRNGFGALRETTFASFSQVSATSGGRIDLGPPRDMAGVFPATGVALRMTDYAALANPPDYDDSAFPVELSDFEPAPHGSGPVQRNDTLIAAGETWSATAFIGRRAGRRAIDSLKAIVGSLAFPRQRRGTEAGHTNYDLGSTARFPPGSFTPVHEPFIGLVYVVHAPGRPAPGINPACLQGACAAPGSYYGIAPNSLVAYSGSDCRLVLDRIDDEFHCPRASARWNRLGLAIAPNRNPPLELVGAKTTWDGQLVLDGTTFTLRATQATVRHDARLLWPQWTHLGGSTATSAVALGR